MKQIKTMTLAFTYVGCFLGAGFISGQELWQFFGSFGAKGVAGLLVAVALFLSCGEKEYAFLEKEPLEVPPERSWVIWTVAGVLFGAVMTVMRLLNRKK